MIQSDVWAGPPDEPPEHPDEIRAREEAMTEKRVQESDLLEEEFRDLEREVVVREASQKPGYWYEHVNGSLHWKPFVVVDMGGGPFVYFDSPMVQRWWKVEEAHPMTTRDSRPESEPETKRRVNRTGHAGDCPMAYMYGHCTCGYTPQIKARRPDSEGSEP